MGNTVKRRATSPEPAVRMSNGATSVLLSVLLLAGSDLAKSEWERRLMVWLSGHDQAFRGAGMVGFDLDEIKWSPSDFDAQRAFVLRVIDRAIERHRWEALDYTPGPIDEHLRRLCELLAGFDPEPAGATTDFERTPGEGQAMNQFTEHRVYTHLGGCLICNDRALVSG